MWDSPEGQIPLETFHVPYTAHRRPDGRPAGRNRVAQPANAPPSNLSNSARNAPDYDDDNGPPPGYQGPPPGYQGGPQQGAAPSAQQAQADRDMFCRRDAAARTGYTTPA